MMKTSRLLIAILSITTLLTSVTVVWQARSIRELAKEQAALRNDLHTALVIKLGNAPAPPADSSERERLELIKLRHENRQLRESLVEARAAQPTGLKGLIRSVMPSGAPAPIRFRPEWYGAMQQNLTNQYASTMAGITNGTNAYVRFLNLSRAAKESLAMGLADDARRYAEDAILLNDKYSRGAPEKVNGDVVHDANLVLGRIAGDEGRWDDAKRYLLAAGQTTGSPVLSSFGPNMGLAKDLLEHGEQETVLKYFELCRKFWSNTEKLNQWKADVEAGRVPEFGGNLFY